MPKFIIKHGCCYIPPLDSESTTSTYQVYTNSDFESGAPSDGLCGTEKGRPESKITEYEQIIHCEGPKNENAVQILDDNTRATESKIGESINELHNITGEMSLVEIEIEQRDVKKVLCTEVSDESIYRPTTRNLKNLQPSRSAKLLDSLSTCFLKCSPWCQKVD